MADRNKLASALLNQTPGYKYGTILPMAYNPTTGDRKIAMPGLLAEMLNSPVKMGQMARGERDIDPGEVFQASMDFSPVGLLNKAPVGALGMNVFQGSPHKYGPKGASQSLKHIGKGEGAQAYGWGRYDAGAKEVAEQYQKNLSGETKIGGKTAEWSHPINLHSGDIDAAILETRNKIKNNPNVGPRAKGLWEKTLAELEGLKASGDFEYINTGNLYKHDLPDEDIARYLDWDKPLSEQPESVRAAIKEFMGDEWSDALKHYPELTVNGLPSGYAKMTGEDFLSMFRERVGGDKQAASEALRKAGIPGLQYYDGASRNSLWDVTMYGDAYKVIDPQTGRGPLFKTRAEADSYIEKQAGPKTRNYVTWDQDVLDRMKLLERNGETFTSQTPPIAGLLSQKDREKREGLAGLLADGVRRGMAGGVF